jgi:hypothetical protein
MMIKLCENNLENYFEYLKKKDYNCGNDYWE